MVMPFWSMASWAQGRTFVRAIPAINAEGNTGHWWGPSPWGDSVDRSSASRFERTANHSRCPSIARAGFDFHLSQEWIGMAYSSLICPHGHIYDARGPGRRTAANGSNTGNARSHATCYVGGEGDPLTASAKRAFHQEQQRLGKLRWSHMDWVSTSCGGPEVTAYVRAGAPGPTGSPSPQQDSEEEELMSVKDTIVAAIEGAVNRMVTRVAWGALDLQLQLGRPGVIVKIPDSNTQWLFWFGADGKPVRVGLTSMEKRDLLRKTLLASNRIIDLTDQALIDEFLSIEEVRW